MEATLLKHELGKSGTSLDGAREEFKRILLNDGIVWGYRPKKADKPNRWNLDSKSILLNPRGAYLASQLFIEKLDHYNVKYIGGLTLASHLITSSIVFLSSFSNHKYEGFLIRKKRKKHGLLKQIEGVIEPNSDVAIIDDGLNAAGFTTKSIKAVEELGCRVKCVVILLNFRSKEFNELVAKGYRIEDIFTLEDLGLQHSNIFLKDMFLLKWNYGILNKSDYSAPKSTPFINENGIYIGSDQNKIISLDFNGSIRWQFDTDYHEEGVHSSPAVFDGKVVCGSYSGYLYALKENDGALLWKNKKCDFIGSSPVIDSENRVMYIGLENKTLKGTIGAFNLDDGQLLWEFVTNNHVAVRPELSDDLIVFGSNDCNLYVCDKMNGKLVWKFMTRGEVKGLSVDSETKRIYLTSFDGFLYCLENTGDLVWKKKLGSSLYNRPLIYDGKIYVGSYSGQISSLNKDTGKVEWYFMTGDSIISSPIEHDGLIFIGSNDGCLYALEPINGHLVWRYQTGARITSSPRAYKDKIFANSNDGYLYCFKKILKNEQKN